MSSPGVRVRKVIEVLDSPVDVYGVSADVPVEFIPVDSGIAVRMVAAVETIRMVGANVSSVPCRIPVERGVVIRNRAAGPVGSPGIPTPVARQRADRNACAE